MERIVNIMARYAQGEYKIKNSKKYLGNRLPRYRSSWEFFFCKMCDENPAIVNWASEAIKIPYRNPLTGKQTIYVPDFFITYLDRDGQQHVELIEVKPSNQSIRERVGKSVHNQAHYILNQAKWEAARAWCRQNNIKFRVVNEGDIFHQGRR
jgi:hypothetical protein